MTFLLIALNLLVLGTIVVVLASYIPRKLADEGYKLWVKPPANSLVVITRDSSVVKILINSNDGQIINRLKQCLELNNITGSVKKNKEIFIKEGKEIVFLRTGALCFVGLPWKFKVHEWYEKQIDEDDPNIEPKWFLTLQERTVDYTFSGDDAVSTADMVSVTGKLVLQTVTFNPLKTIFSVQYWSEALRAKIFSEWRHVVTGLSYFKADIDMTTLMDPEKNKTGKGLLEAMINPELSRNVQKELLKALGLLTNDDKLLPIGSVPAEGTIAHQIYDEWGIMFTVAVKDIDITDIKTQELLDRLKQASIDTVQQMMEGFSKAQSEKLVGFKENDIIEDLARRLDATEAGRMLIAGKALKEGLSTTNTFVAGTAGISEILAFIKAMTQEGKKGGPS